jgi:hypothetical protein
LSVNHYVHLLKLFLTLQWHGAQTIMFEDRIVSAVYHSDCWRLLESWAVHRMKAYSEQSISLPVIALSLCLQFDCRAFGNSKAQWEVSTCKWKSKMGLRLDSDFPNAMPCHGKQWKQYAIATVELYTEIKPHRDWTVKEHSI